MIDWHTPQNYEGETMLVSSQHRDTSEGGRDTSGPFDVYGYSFTLNSAKTVASITLPNNSNVEFLAITMVAIAASP